MIKEDEGEEEKKLSSLMLKSFFNLTPIKKIKIKWIILQKVRVTCL